MPITTNRIFRFNIIDAYNKNYLITVYEVNAPVTVIFEKILNIYFLIFNMFRGPAEFNVIKFSLNFEIIKKRI